MFSSLSRFTLSYISREDITVRSKTSHESLLHLNQEKKKVCNISWEFHRRKRKERKINKKKKTKKRQIKKNRKIKKTRKQRHRTVLGRQVLQTFSSFSLFFFSSIPFHLPQTFFSLTLHSLLSPPLEFHINQPSSVHFSVLLRSAPIFIIIVIIISANESDYPIRSLRAADEERREKKKRNEGEGRETFVAGTSEGTGKGK